MQAAPQTTRRLRFVLRDFRVVEADAHFVEGQALVSYLARRRNWVTLLDACWIGTGERIARIVLRVQQILWVEARDAVPAAIPAASARPRGVEVRLEGGLVLRGGLPVHEDQRLADYLESAGDFVPLLRAHLMRSGRPPRSTNLVLRDVAIHRDGIQSVAEAEVVPGAHSTDEGTAADLRTAGS